MKTHFFALFLPYNEMKIMFTEARLMKFLRIFLAATFIISSIAKIYSLNFFDELVAKQLIGEDYFEKMDKFYYVQWLTRVLIAGEFMLGVAVLQERFLRKIILPSMILLLFVFIIQVFYEGYFKGKGFIGGNCGCFGEVIPFDNFETIIKNIVLIAVALVVYFRFKDNSEMAISGVTITYVVGAFTFFTLFLTIKKTDNVTIPDLSDYSQQIEVQDTTSGGIDSVNSTSKEDSIALAKKQITTTIVDGLDQKKTTSNSIFANYKNFSGGVVKDLDKGTHLLCLFSFTCGHCQDAFKDILELRKKGGKTGDVFVIGYGSESDEKRFWNTTGGKVPFIRIEDNVEFVKLRQGDDFPKIIVKKNGETKKSWVYDTYSKESLFEYFGISHSPEVKTGNGGNGIIIEKPKGDVIIETNDEGGLF